MSTTYKHYTDADGNPMQVESAVRDGKGKNIENNYVKHNTYDETLRVGNSDQLVATVGVTDKVPYNFRTAGGSADIGNRLNDKIVGGTINWNQLVQNGNFESTSGWNIAGADVSVADNVLTVAAKSAAPGGNFYNYRTSYKVGHKYLLSLKAKSDTGQVSFSGFGSSFKSFTVSVSQFTGIESIRPAVDATNVFYPFGSGSSVVQGNTAQFKEFMLIDLTAMFGSTIADYVYSLEQATAGAGVAWFKKLFPKPYYAYNAGELMSVCTNEHITRGFNAWNEEWELGQYDESGQPIVQVNSIRSKNYIPVIPDKTYYGKCSKTLYICYYDSNKNFILRENKLNVTFTTPSNAYYIRINTSSSYGATYLNDICINLSWSGYRNGEYEPYVEHRYPLSPIELRGIPMLDASNNLHFDGDTYEKDGTVTRKYEEDDVTSYTWVWNTSLLIWQTTSVSSKIKKALSNTEKFTWGVFPGFEGASYTEISARVKDKTVAVNTSGTFFVYDSSLSENTPPTGDVLFELAIPTTETADPFTDPQIVDDFGTEEYVDALATAETSPRDVAIPVGHETFYQANLRDKLQNLPVNANADGLYLVKQTGNKMELIAYTPESELPASPSNEGTYVLKLVDGTLTWVLEE